jgi:hypothetical protein
MNNDRRINLKTVALLSMLIVSGLIVSACGGESGSGSGSTQSAGIGGTGIVQGRVTGFGSIFINGQKFNTDSSEFFVDGNPDGSQDDLAIGMIVTLEVETSQGANTAKALNVIYDDEVQGPVSATPVDVPGSAGIQKTFKVFGQTITIDEIETEFEDTSFATLDKNDVVEISGYRRSADQVTASYVEWKERLKEGESEVELRGTISELNSSTRRFMLDGFLITFNNSTEIDVSGGVLGNGMYVEVEGIYEAGPSVSASDIEEEDEGLGDDVDEASLQGLIYDYMGIDDFKINGQQVDASQASLSPANAQTLLTNGVDVEVQGNIVDGVLMADELELNEIEIALKAFVFAVDAANNRFEVNYTNLGGSIVIETNAETEFEDNGLAPVADFSVDDIIVGDFVAVEGLESSGKVIAGSIERQDLTDPDDSELRGQVDSFSASTPSVTVLGISYMVGGAEYKDSSGTISETKFFNNLANGDRVEITDEEPADGSAEEVKLDD